jgi:hypothetical protein
MQQPTLPVDLSRVSCFEKRRLFKLQEKYSEECEADGQAIYQASLRHVPCSIFKCCCEDRLRMALRASCEAQDNLEKIREALTRPQKRR